VEESGRRRYVTGMEEAPENGKESSHSAHASGMNEWNMGKRGNMVALHTV
jgi:hypothetical protein